MKLVFLTNIVNHHQIPLADELYKLLGDNYRFIAFEELPQWLRTGGYSEITRPYIVQAYNDDVDIGFLTEVVDNADVVIIGSAPECLVHKRVSENKITFHYSERWFKKKIGIHILSPKLWYSLYINHIRFRRKRSYLLCASAYAAKDAYQVFAYRGKCFKWGYFTKVQEYDIEELLDLKKNTEIKLMWCARFLDWKHPELAVKLAYVLKNKGYKFTLDMFGSGLKLDETKKLANALDVEDVVIFRGNLPNESILEQMRLHHIFIFTSDCNEGWGAVANEAMSNGCVLVGADAIGSVPFLLKDAENGCIFKSCDLDSLVSKVEYLLNHRDELRRLAINGYNTMKYIWSPMKAASSLLQLIDDIKNDCSSSIIEGPCSIAELL